MTQPSSTDVTPAKNAQARSDAASLLAWLPHLAKAQDTEDEPTGYASPPCYLAQFSDVDFAEETAK